jgi:hypothetical protein
MSPVTVVDILALLTLMSAVIFGILEVRRAARARREKAAMELVMSVGIRPEHVLALQTILELPEGASAQRVLKKAELKRAADQLINQFEYFGAIVFQRMVPLHTLDLLIGGVVRASWKRLKNYVEYQRKELRLKNQGEWFQWLVERLEEHPSREKKLGAHVAFRDWRL